MKKVILFDMDGTLNESGEGITKSVQYALVKMGKPEESLENLRVFIGPPMLQQLMEYSNMNEIEAKKAIEIYRERYSTIGLFENSIYNGVVDMLSKLKKEGYILAVASSKPEIFVKQILEHYEMYTYFDEIVGATLDQSRTSKADVIKEAMTRMELFNCKSEVLMVGDKKHDVLGAKTIGIDCVAVTYGYGTKEELEKEKPMHIVNSVKELEEYILSL